MSKLALANLPAPLQSVRTRPVFVMQRDGRTTHVGHRPAGGPVASIFEVQ